MVFSSIVFLFYFLPAVLLGYHLIFLPVSLGWHASFFRRASNLFLLAASLLFYFWGESFLVWIVITSTMIDYLCGLVISREISRRGGNDRPTLKMRMALLASITSNLAFLGFFKYVNFGLDNLNTVIAGMGLESAQWLDFPHIILPLGISFYTFQSMSYTIDVYRGRVKATRNLGDFACYVTMFPQLVAGPIVRYRDVAAQLVERTISRSTFASGVVRFVVGLGKKVLIANTVATAADAIFALPTADLTAAVAWVGVIAYALQIYFDFSGYSDMAIGLGRMLGFDFLENFNYPYIAENIQDFWRRWHISLSTWFRDYLYIPLGGSKKSNGRTYANLVTVFFLCGLWHGASWSFVFWGLFHGVFLVAERLGLARFVSRLPGLLRHAYTLLVVLVGWVFFRADTLAGAFDYLGAMAGLGHGGGFPRVLAEFLQPDVAIAMFAGVLGSAPLVPAINRWLSRLTDGRPVLARTCGGLSVAVLGALMLMVTMRLASGSYNPFIYFRF